MNNDLGANARHVARELDKLRLSGSLSEGVDLPKGGKLKVVTNFYNTEIPEAWNISKPDNRIIQICKALKEKGEDVCLITKDIFERIKADTVGIKSEDFYEVVVPEFEEQYSGRMEVYTSSECLSKFFKNKVMEKKDLTSYNEENKCYVEPKLEINQFLIIHCNDNDKQTALGRFDGKVIRPLLYKDNNNIMGISPRNVGQKFMLECLSMDAKKAPLVIIKGPAGTAKNVIFISCGITKDIRRGKWTI